MRVAITPAARADLSRIRDFIRNDNPHAAKRIGARLSAAFRSLAAYPNRGKPGSVAGTRENASVWPYVIVYRVASAEVQILRVWHGAQDREA